MDIEERMIQAKRNECLNLLRLGNREVNTIRESNSEGQAHREMKRKICAELWKQNKQFVTEAIFKKGGRADIFILDDFEVIEIVNTENTESIERKKQTYPKGLNIKVVKVGNN